MKERFVAFGWPADMIDVVYNSYDNNLLGEKLTEDDFLLYFGGLSEEKGINILIKAAAKLNQKTILAGEGRSESELKNLAQKLKAPVEFCGYKSGEELKNLILRARAIVIPSIWPENMPLSLLESLSLGKIVIASNIGGIPEIIKDGINGFLFEAGNQESLQEKMKKVLTLSEAEREKIKQEAKLSVDKFNSKNNFASIIKIYRSLIK